MSNKQARASEKLVLKELAAIFTDGSLTYLDLTKVQIVDRKTKKPIFKEK